ncbi:MAG: TetR/AcrR family transcriptional regulator [Microthrixaceae bacterium]
MARRGTLSTGAIVDAALALVDREGMAGLSMRRLGKVLDCEAMSLYKHVADKESLLDLLVERIMGEIALPDPTAPWDERIQALLRELRRVGLAHPALFERLAVRLPSTPAALEPVEATLSALRAAGLDDRATASWFWALVAYATGAIIGELGAASAAFPYEGPPLDPEAFPALAALAPTLAACDYEEEFERGLSVLLAAISQPHADSLPIG